MKEHPLSTLLAVIITLLCIQGTYALQLFKGEKMLFPENKELIKSLKIRSKLMYVYICINDQLIPQKSKNLFESCQYDDNGNIIEDYYPGFDGKIKCTKYIYHGNKLIRTLAGTLGNEPDIYEDSYYDSSGNLVKEIRYSISGTFNVLTEYSYDACNVLLSKRTYGQYVTTYMYEHDSIGNLINTIVADPAGIRYSNSRSFTYVKNAQVLEIKYFSNGVLESTTSLKYDSSSNKIEEKTHWEDLYEDRMSKYEYDDLGRVTSSIQFQGSSSDFNSHFKYDNRGLMTEKINFSSNGSPASIYKYIYLSY